MRAAWWWIDRWRKSTAYTDMTLAEQGAYRNLLDELWLRDGVLPDNDRILGKVAGDVHEWPSVREVVMRRFIKVNGGWRNPTHDEVAAFPAAQAEKGRMRMAGMTDAERRAFGKRAAEARWGKIHKSPGQHTSRIPADCQPPSPSPSPSLRDLSTERSRKVPTAPLRAGK